MRPVFAAALAVALLAALPAGSAVRPAPPALIAKGLAAAVDAGRLTPGEAASYSAVLAEARGELKRVPPLRAQLLAAVIADVAAQWRAYTAPRALALFSTLSLNTQWLAGHKLTGPHPDITGADGAVYRFFSSHGYVFHPLANFARLNAEVAAGDLAGTERLTAALLARAVPVGQKLVWEYEFPFSTGPAPWTSGMVQAVAAQALARAGDLLSDPALLDAADGAYRAVAGLLSPSSPAKPWVALYSFDRTPVLNAQLQAVLSIGDYAAIAGDPAADALAARLTDSARALLPRFDTGYWSLYSLKGDESSLDYHDYVVALLGKIGTRTGEPAWKQVADRFRAYETQPPLIRPGPVPPTVYPRPADGYRDEAAINFWLSKRSTVTLRVGGRTMTETLGHGENTINWPATGAAPGVYRPLLSVVGPEGRRAEEALPPVTVAREPGPPPLQVRVSAPATLTWQSTAEGTPWLELRVRLLQGATAQVVELGRGGLSGTRPLPLPPGRWHATLLASNSAGKTRSVSLGYLPR